MTEVTFRSDVTVEMVRDYARDSDVIWAAKVSTLGGRSREEMVKDPEASGGLIRYLMRDRHGSPFEHNSMTFYVEAPIFVFREFQRHRIASYNEESGRYTQLKPVFYIPARDRNLRQIGKPGAYEFVPGSREQWEDVVWAHKEISTLSYENYEHLLSIGIAREVARMTLPLNIFSSMYVTMNARALMNFLSLRVKSEDSTYKSFPQREIEMCAEKIEAEWQKLMPLTHQAFVDYGRVAP